MTANYPKIGIRPTIDGRRRGVRESLEAQTMGMAERVAAFLQKNLFYPDGSHVECIIADSTIGGVKEAAAAAQKFAGAGVGVSITVTPCWCYGSETMDMDASIPHAVWGFNGTERPGAVYLAAVLSAYAQRVFRPSASTARMFRNPAAKRSRRMCRPSCSSSRSRHLQLH